MKKLKKVNVVKALIKRITLTAALPLALLVLAYIVWPKQLSVEFMPTSPKVMFAIDPLPEFAPVSSLIVSEDFVAGYEAGKELLRLVLSWQVQGLVLEGQPQEALEAKEWYQSLVQDKPSARERLRLLPIPHESVWVRDFGPAFSRWTFVGKVFDEPVWSKLALVDFLYRDERSLSDTVPYLLGIYLHKSVDTLPLVLDGGSYLSDGKDCFVTTPDLDEASSFIVQEGKNAQHSIATFKRHMRQALGCRNVTLFPNAAHDHIDMWAKIVDEKTVFVNEIPDDVLAMLEEKFGAVDDEITILKHKLDTAAGVFGQSLHVERIPMPLPEFGVFRTYANALLINGYAVIPRYSQLNKQGEQLVDADFLVRHEKAVSALFAKYGYQSSFIDADKVIADGGAFHCVAVQVPKL